MNELWIKTLLAGLFFGAWPLFMNRSGLPGNVSVVVVCAVGLLGALPFAVKQMNGSLALANWTMAIAAGLAVVLGLLTFNGMLAKATPEKVSTFFFVNLLVQISVPAVYQTMLTGRLSFHRGMGFATAAVAAYLLTR